jgi:hypothetical protein
MEYCGNIHVVPCAIVLPPRKPHISQSVQNHALSVTLIPTPKPPGTKQKTPAKCLTWQGFLMVAEEGYSHYPTTIKAAAYTIPC